MKTLLISLLLCVSIGYSQGFSAYMFEYGTIDTVTRHHHRDTVITLDNVAVELNEDNFTVYTQKLQQYHFYQDLDVKFEGDDIYQHTSMVIDQDSDIAMLIYWYNRTTNSRIIMIDYNNMYIKYYIKS